MRLDQTGCLNRKLGREKRAVYCRRWVKQNGATEEKGNINGNITIKFTSEVFHFEIIRHYEN